MKWLKNLTYCFLIGCLIVFSISNDTGYPAFSQASAFSIPGPQLAINHQTKEYTYTLLFDGLCPPCEYGLKKGWQWSDSPFFDVRRHKICPKGFEDAQREFCFSKQGPPKRRITKRQLPDGRVVTCPEGYSRLGHDVCLSEDRRIKEWVLDKGRRVCPKGSEKFKNMFCLSISSEGKIKEKKRICPVKYVENPTKYMENPPTKYTQVCKHAKFRNYKKINYSIKECKKPIKRKLPACCEEGDCSGILGGGISID